MPWAPTDPKYCLNFQNDAFLQHFYIYHDYHLHVFAKPLLDRTISLNLKQ